jgi:signal peptidase II
VAFVVVALVSLLLDQVTKWWVYTHLALGVDEIVVIPGWFSIVHRQNPGAAFGFLGGFANARILFLVFSVIAMGVLLDMVRKARPDDAVLGAIVGLVFSGALGNAIDRLHKATVTDFLKVYSDSPWLADRLTSWFHTNEWPTFNVADSALVVGVALYLLHQTFLEGKKEPTPQASPTPSAGA